MTYYVVLRTSPFMEDCKRAKVVAVCTSMEKAVAVKEEVITEFRTRIAAEGWQFDTCEISDVSFAVFLSGNPEHGIAEVYIDVIDC